MRQEHKLGEKLFLDWAGDTLRLTDAETGEVRPCYLFVAAFGASNYTYAEPSLSQDLSCFLQAHVRMFSFFGGAPELLVPDYVPGHIIGLMFPPVLCGRGLAKALVSWRRALVPAHNDHRESSHRSNSWSSRHVALRGNPGE